MKQQYYDTDEVITRDDEESFSFKKRFFRMLRLWPWFLLSLLVCVSAAYLYLVYTNPVYKAIASVMVKDEKKGADLMNNITLKEIGLNGSAKLVENEIEILKSYDLMEAVVRKLQLFVSIKRVGRIRNDDVFGTEVPFSVEITNPDAIKESSLWTITQTARGILFKTQFNKEPVLIKYDQTYHSGGIHFRFMRANFYSEQSPDSTDVSTVIYRLYINPVSETTLSYTGKLSVEAASKLATVINLTMKDTDKERVVAILDSLIYIYNQQGLQDKNRMSENTVNFLNDRLVAVSDKLQGVEGSVEKLKSENKVTDLSSDAQQYLAVSQQVDEQKAQSQTQLNIINALEQNLEQNQNDPQLVPSTLGIQEPSMGLLIEKHNELILQKERMQQKSGPKNPLLIDMENQIKELRAKLLTNVRNLKQAYTISLDDITRKDEQLNNRIRNVPQLEKRLVQITRNQNVQELLYAFLLQKREEAALTLASNIEDSRTILKARDVGIVWPKSKLILIAGIMLGLALPTSFVSVRDFLNNKIGDISQVEQLTDIPMLGIISHVRKLRSPLVINSRTKSVVAEQIRNIRTAINFAGDGKVIKSILITSFQLGDGKSFISLNLAAGYALLNRKTVILEFDLRKPRITKDLGMDRKEGISNILSGKSTLDQLLVEIPGYNNNLFLLPAGYAPANPAELISGPAMAYLMKKLHERFDYIIIDTPPFSIVTDATLLQQYADITILVLRQDHTSRDIYTELKHASAYHHPANTTFLLLNDVGKRKRYRGGYRYAGYGKGYYLEEK